MNYSTFWNDFSHYSLMQGGEPEEIQSELQRTGPKDDILFADKSKFTQLASTCVEFQESKSEYVTESFVHQSDQDG